MNIPTPVKLADLKEGELYFEEIFLYDIFCFFIIKIEKILINNSEKRIEYLRSDPEEYYIFSDILEFKNSVRVLSSYSYHLFLKDNIQIKNSNVKYYFYNFDKEWFLKNKRKILLYMGDSFSSKKSFLDIFQEIESEKIWIFQNPSFYKI